MKRAALMRLLGNDLVHTLEQLTKDTPSDEALRKVAQVLYGDNNPAALQEQVVRNQIIDALPLEKARELTQKLGLFSAGNIYQSLKRFDSKSDPNRAAALRSFFGIVEDMTAQPIRKPAVGEVSPEYGLFDHQRDVALRTRQALSESPHKAVVHMPTGAGKTRTAMHILARHLLERGPTLVCWLANSAELLEQAAEDFEKSWRVLGDRPVKLFRFWGDRSIDLHTLRDGVLVAGFAKMHAAYMREQNAFIALGDRTSLTIVDEAHQAIAPTYRSVIEALFTKRPQNQLLGLTATPGRTWDNIEADAELSAFFGNAKVTLSVSKYSEPVEFLMAEGYLAKPVFRTLSFEGAMDLPGAEELEGGSTSDLSDNALDTIARNGERNFLIIQAIEELLSRHKRVIVFGASVRHAHLIAGLLIARSHDAKMITGETPIARRERLIRQFKSDSPQSMIMCNYGVLTTGFDAPKTSAAVIARPTKSLVLYSQMVGRATRGPRAGGNEVAEIVTVIDTALPGFGSVAEAFKNWEDVWHEHE
ncbi:type III restriction protein res subunit [Nitrosococcus halophilus Nc 4]|uniref:Type III restriction protein res subunit n=1 Tax=Nitrosococcus halophilus (strain Nc4) TaxID=472759 RepID=D5C4B2_NITHN|nr:DEAD/DEAH box helicase [Nitrosococcus halophilus]ADE13300.1 type III restriction protein res subunit [Nitrosococcus halophilus Nc 4]